MRILITGSTGFIGAALCKACIAEGYQVIAFHRPTSNTRLIDYLPIEHKIGDLTQPDSLIDAMKDVQVVFHAAAMFGGSQESGRMYSVNVEGTRAVLIAAQQAGIERVVHTSSVAALGVPQPDHPTDNFFHSMDENHTWNYIPQRWPYAYSKYLAEREVQQAVARGLDVVIVNPSVIFGAGDLYRQQSSMIVKVAQKRLPAMVDGGINVVHLSDVVAGHLGALKYGRVGERYILGGENLTIVELINKIAQIVGVNPPSYMVPASIIRLFASPVSFLQSFIDLPLEPELLHMAGQYFYYSSEKAQSELGITSPRPTEEAIQEAYSWFQDAGAISRIT